MSDIEKIRERADNAICSCDDIYALLHIVERARDPRFEDVFITYEMYDEAANMYAEQAQVLRASQAREEELRKKLATYERPMELARILVQSWRNSAAEYGITWGDTDGGKLLLDAALALETALDAAPSIAEPERDAEWIPDARFDEEPTPFHAETHEKNEERA